MVPAEPQLASPLPLEGATRHQRWTQRHVTELRDGVAAGSDLTTIATQLGRTVEDVEAMANRLRLRLV
jgi:hypothetical protein